MEYRLTRHEAAQMFEIWRRELEASPGLRAVEAGQIRLDSVGSQRGAAHAMDGSLVIVTYEAYRHATERAVREAAVATEMMHMPRSFYTGRLIDILRAADGSVFFRVRTLERIDETTHQPAFRSFAPSKGTLIELVINPGAAALADPLAAGRQPQVSVAAIVNGGQSDGVQHPSAQLR